MVFPYAIIYTLFNAYKYDVLFVGDSLLCFLGFLSKIFYKKTKVYINVYGLDITYKNSIYQFYLKLFLKNSANCFIAISKETEKLLIKRGITKTIIITPGIDVNMYQKETHKNINFYDKYNIKKDNLIVITVGRLIERKGVAWFIENVVPKLKSDNITYLIIGDGENREKIKSLINKIKTDIQINMLGRLSDEDLKEVYLNSDIFVMPNIKVKNDMEGFGIVALEASLAGLIVLASGIEGIKDAIINNKNGFLIDSRDSHGFADKIEEININRKKYNMEAKKFCEYTKKNYSWEAICQKYIEKLSE